MSESIDPPPRIVKPRHREYKWRPVVAVLGSEVVDEHGEKWELDAFIETIPDRSPTLFACLGAADFVGYLDTIFAPRYHDTWQWRTSVHEREVCGPNGLRVATRMNTVIHYFGWKGGNYHKIIDPISMYAHRLDTIWPGDVPGIEKLVRWGVAIRDFCDEQKIDVRPTSGGLSAQFLTDPRFYPQARRKVPAATNRSVRERLPGNYYYLNTVPRPNREWTAHYLDQHRAHHYHARNTSLPNANHLYAYGRFIDLDGIAFRDTIPRFYGLYCLDLEYDRSTSQRAFHWFGNEGLTKRFVYSNELTHVIDMGYRVLGVRAAWGSTHLDEGLGKYACWCEEQLDRYQDAPWLKPILLSAYGTLATRPKHAEAVFRLATKGDPITVLTGHHELQGLHTKGRVKLEPRIANVLHRGMIEAATRSESVGLAQYLEHTGQQVLSIYADAVMVADNEELPLPELPEPWRLKDTLHHLRFLNQQAFTSGEMTKLPGVSREATVFNRGRTGYAPRKPLYNIFTGRRLTTAEAKMFKIDSNRRI